MIPVFADPKTDFVFKRIFGAAGRKPLLIALLNDLLELDGDQRILDVQHLSLEQHVSVPELKLSIVDVKCTDATGRRFVVEMQVAKVEGLEKRIVYNASKAYVMQLRSAEEYPTLCDVVGVTICNFKLWPRKLKSGRYKVPMLSRWRMQEKHSNKSGVVEGKRDTLLRLLTRARIALTDDDRARIQACTDAAALDRWTENVLGAKTASDMLS